MNSKQHELLIAIPLQGMLMGLSADEIVEVLKESIKLAEESKLIVKQLQETSFNE